MRVASTLTPDDLLFVYLSGHSFSDDNKRDYFLPYDAKISSLEASGIRTEELIERTLKEHKRVVFVLDAAYDPKDFDQNLLSDAALLIAGTSPNLIMEGEWRGTFHGAFTAALIQALASFPESLPISTRDVYIRSVAIV